MYFDFWFFLNSILFGIGLAMDAFSISLANGLNEPEMKSKRMIGISSVYGIFQTVMPLIGWACVHTISTLFEKFNKFIPWIAFSLLLYIGGKMIIEALQKEESNENISLSFTMLLIQGLATSIDALSVGFTIADYNFIQTLIEVLIIGFVTFVICYLGLIIGKRFGTKLGSKASLLGGSILIIIGLEILIKSFL